MDENKSPNLVDFFLSLTSPFFLSLSSSVRPIGLHFHFSTLSNHVNFITFISLRYLDNNFWTMLFFLRLLSLTLFFFLAELWFGRFVLFAPICHSPVPRNRVSFLILILAWRRVWTNDVFKNYISLLAPSPCTMLVPIYPNIVPTTQP